MEQSIALLGQQLLALINLVNHSLPIFLFFSSLILAGAFSQLIGRQVAQAVIFQMQSHLKIISVVIRQLNALTFERHLQTVSYKMQIVVDSSHSLFSRPTWTEYLNENISKHKFTAGLLFQLLVDAHSLINYFLSPCSTNCHKIIVV